MEVYSVPTTLGVRTKAVKERLSSPADLPSVEDTKADIARDIAKTLSRLSGELSEQDRAKRQEFEMRRAVLVKRQNAQREALRRKQDARQLEETKRRAGRFRSGVSGLWDRLRGEHKRIQVVNEREAYACSRRDQTERDALIFSHIEERRALDLFRRRIKAELRQERRELERDRRSYAPDPQ